MTERLVGGGGALIAILAVLGAMLPWRAPLPLQVFDQPFYIGIANDLVADQRFTDGFMFAPAGADGTRPPGMRFGPLYPAMLAAAAEIDPGLRASFGCVVARGTHTTECGRRATLVRGVQLAALALVLWLVWWFGARLAGGTSGGWLALAATLPAWPMLLMQATTLMTETVTLLFTTAASAAALQALRGGRPVAWCAACGALVGFAALTRPGFQYLVPVAVLLLLGVRWRGAWRAAPAAGFLLAAGVVLLPWIVRNAVMFGRPALSFGYDSHTLVQRIAFDTMSWREYGLSWLCFLPDGNGIGQAVGGHGACDRFGWDERPDTFYALGLRVMLRDTLIASGGMAHHLRYLLTHYVLRMPGWHAAVTLPLALRGAVIEHWWGFLAMLSAIVATMRAARRREAGLLALALPAWFMLLFNAAVAVNQPRYNVMLVPLYGVALARLARRAWRGLPPAIRDRRWARGGGSEAIRSA